MGGFILTRCFLVALFIGLFFISLKAEHIQAQELPDLIFADSRVEISYGNGVRRDVHFDLLFQSTTTDTGDSKITIETEPLEHGGVELEVNFNENTPVLLRQFNLPTFYPQVQHSPQQQISPRIMNNVQPLSLNNEEMLYTHITSPDRNELSVLLRAKIKKKEIARLLKKDRVTIWRERKRNGEANGTYHARKAKSRTTEKQIKAHARQRKLKNDLWRRNYVEKKIKQRWSPEQIAGRLQTTYPDNKKKWVGKDTIYRHLYTERKDLVKYLRCQKGKYRRRYGTRLREKQRDEAKKKRIDTRPDVVVTKERIGDWEGDTIVGSDKQHMLTHTERKSGLLFADRLLHPTAQETNDVTIRRFEKIPTQKKQTITYDNGVTFSYHELTEKETGVDIYFAYPYHSWERGCNENSNGLLRQYFPKKTPLGNVSQKEIDRVVREINHRPRKRLGYVTPYEVFYEKNEKYAAI